MSTTEIVLSASGLGAGKKGSELGIQAFRIAAAQGNYNLFTKYPVTAVQGEHSLYSSSDKYQKDFLDAIVQVNEQISDAVADAFTRAQKVINITGDHSNAVGSISGLRKAHPESSIGVIWIDAHADLHSPYSTPSFNIHGMPLAALCGLDNRSVGETKPSDVQVSFWEAFKNVGGAGISPKIAPKDIVFIDIRDLEDPEWEVIKKNDIKHFEPKDVQRLGVEEVISQTLEVLKDKDIIYVTFDVDSLDPSISEGTGTPVPNGLKATEAIALLKAFYHHSKCKMLEITEINPILDKENAMAKAVTEIMREVAI